MLYRTLLSVLSATLGAHAFADTLALSEAWARATPPGATTGAAYLEIDNRGADDRLIGARSPAAGAVEIHTTAQQDGMMRMQRLETLALPTGQTTVLAPGGHHIMLIDLRQPLIPGETIRVTLAFEKAGSIDVDFPVRDARTMAR